MACFSATPSITLPITSLDGVELRLLRQIARRRPFGQPGLAGELGVEPRHDTQQGGFTGTVRAEHADLGVRVKRQVDVLQNLFATGIALGEPMHVIDELPRHDLGLFLS